MGEKGGTQRNMDMDPTCSDRTGSSLLVWSNWRRRTSAKWQEGHSVEAWQCHTATQKQDQAMASSGTAGGGWHHPHARDGAAKSQLQENSRTQAGTK